MWPLSHSLAVLVLSLTFVHLTEHAHTHIEKRHTVHKDKEELCTGIHA